MKRRANKHVIIAGTPRAGKTTLCLELLKYGFIHYKVDSIKRGICKAFGYDQHDWKFLNEKITEIVNTIIHENGTDTVYGYEYYAMDTVHMLPEDTKLIKEDVLIVYLGYTDIEPQEKLKEMRKYDKKHYWSSYLSDEELLRMINADIGLSKKIKEDCSRLGIKYFDTSYNRDEVLKEVLDYILDNCTEKEIVE